MVYPAEFIQHNWISGQKFPFKSVYITFSIKKKKFKIMLQNI